MIVNVKTMMAIVMATVLMLAVVIPITGAMVGLSAEKGYADNEITGSDYRMAKAGASADLMITNSNGSIKLYVGDAEGVTMEPYEDFILTDTFILKAATVDNEPEFQVTVFGSQTPVYGQTEGSYMTIHDGKWAIYGTGSPRSTKEVKEVKELKQSGGSTKADPQPDVQGYFRTVYYADDKGTWLYADAPVNVDTGASFYFIMPDTSVVLLGTLDSMAIVNFPGSATPTITCNYTENGATNTLESITTTFGGESYDETEGFLVPFKYTTDSQVGMTGTLVSLIPLVMIVAIILAAVSMLILHRQEDGF